MRPGAERRNYSMSLRMPPLKGWGLVFFSRPVEWVHSRLTRVEPRTTVSEETVVFSCNTSARRGDNMFDRLKKDVQAVFERDPAAKSVLEVIFCYPGLHAIWFHRLSNRLYRRGWILLPRMISNLARFLTGIEIHPGATIGEGLFIDHGMAVVIGETAEIGDNVTLYQGVTLGGTGKEKGKRHPTVGNNVVIASGAKVLGSFKVGDNSKIGAGSVVLREVPPNSTVVGIPGKVVIKDGCKIAQDRPLGIDLEHDQLPDPEGEMLLCMQRNLLMLEQRITQLEEELKHGAKGV